MADTSPNVQEIWYKGQRVLRSGLQAALIGIPLVLTIVALVQEQFNWPWLASVTAIAVAAQAALAKIMAIPAVDSWLSAKTIFGSVPKSVANQDTAGDDLVEEEDAAQEGYEETDEPVDPQ